VLAVVLGQKQTILIRFMGCRTATAFVISSLFWNIGSALFIYKKIKK
jgi:hypothetical protein